MSSKKSNDSSFFFFRPSGGSLLKNVRFSTKTRAKETSAAKITRKQTNVSRNKSARLKAIVLNKRKSLIKYKTNKEKEDRKKNGTPFNWFNHEIFTLCSCSGFVCVRVAAGRLSNPVMRSIIFLSNETNHWLRLQVALQKLIQMRRIWSLLSKTHFTSFCRISYTAAAFESV